MNHESLLQFAIQHFKENGGTEKPSLEQSGVSTTKVFLRNRIGNLLKEYELDWVVFMCEQQTKTENYEPPANSASETPKQNFSQNSSTEQGNIKESKDGLFGKIWFGFTVFGLAGFALFLSSGTGFFSSGAVMSMLSSFMPSILLTYADKTTTPETSSAPAPSQASNPFAAKTQKEYRVLQSARVEYKYLSMPATGVTGAYKFCLKLGDFISRADFDAKLANGARVVTQGMEEHITIEGGVGINTITDYCYYVSYILEE